MDFQKKLDDAVQNIQKNHAQILENWCKAYMAQLHEEGVEIKPGCFTLVEQVPTYHPGKDCMVKRYWFETGKPEFYKNEDLMEEKKFKLF